QEAIINRTLKLDEGVVKPTMLVQYASNDDASFASQIVAQLGEFYDVTKTKVDPAGDINAVNSFMEDIVPLFDILVVVGGNFANDIYAHLYTDITPDDEGCTIIRYRNWAVLTDTYGVAGWSLNDTQRTVNRFIAIADTLNLPKTDEIIC
ncbi:hypothetical protein LCGC14_2498700, partial [marine sediment metagenome]